MDFTQQRPCTAVLPSNSSHIEEHQPELTPISESHPHVIPSMEGLRNATTHAQDRMNKAEEAYSMAVSEFIQCSQAAKRDRRERDRTMRAALEVPGVTAYIHAEIKTANDKYYNSYISCTEAERKLKQGKQEMDEARSSWKRAKDRESQYEEDRKQRRETGAKEANTRFFEKVDAAFADYSSLRSFPKPPAASCWKKSCEMSKTDRSLEACECSIRSVFKGRVDLKTERLRWHPDRFGRCPESVRESFRKMASEVFVVLDRMYREQ